MASFTYKAKTARGEVVSGRFDAQDKHMVVTLLRSKGYYPIDIVEVRNLGKGNRLFPGRKISLRDLAVFSRQFYTMLNSGVSVIACLDMLRRQTENRQLAEVVGKVYEDVQKGKSLSEAMALHSKAFPVIMTSMVEMGEVSGTLDVVTERLADHFEKENKIKQKINTAMIYPVIIGFIAFLMVIFMLAFVVPQFVSVFENMGAELPLPTRILLGISNGVTNWRIIIPAIGLTAALSYVVNTFRKTEKGRLFTDNVITKIPLIGKNYRKILASRFTRTLSSLLNTGVPLIQALDVVEKVVNSQLVAKGLVKVKEDIKRGSNLAGPLEGIGIFPVMVIQMISIGEEAGSIDSIMEKVADFYDDELDASISRMISLLEPLLILAVAVIVGLIVISLILPVFEMYKGIGK